MLGYRIETMIGELNHHRLVPDDAEPEAGEIVAHIDTTAITANNLTYALFQGEPMHYGRFFPTDSPATHLTVPIWGFATVTRSRAVGVGEGQRFYGYWPAASHVRLQPSDVVRGSFTDTASHRAQQAPIYNQYLPAHSIAPAPSDEPMAALLRPLFGTAFALDDMLGSQPDTRRILLTSASSKTALGTGWLLRKRDGMEVIGLTSAANRAFVESTGCYSRVLIYEEVDRLEPDIPAILADFSGNSGVQQQLHQHVGALKHSWLIGATHWQAGEPRPLAGPQPGFFFAPSVIEGMIVRDGAGRFQRGLSDGLAGFAAHAARFLNLHHSHGPDGFAAAFNPFVSGTAHPADVQIWHPQAV